MIRASTLAFVLFAMCACHALAVEPTYRIIFRNTSGQISLPDEVGRNKKTYFLDLEGVRKGNVQMFGGSGDRFRTVEYWDGGKPEKLTIEEVATKRRIVLEVGVEVDLEKKP